MSEKDWKIYTKKGDKGQTSLIGGTRVDKNNIRVEAYGTIDELKSFCGLLHDYMQAGDSKDFLRGILEYLFLIESHVATDPEKADQKFFPELSEEMVLKLEREIDRMNEELPELQHFILPAGHPAVSTAHICRTVCRRAERRVLDLVTTAPCNDITIKYLNRFSDFLFVLARFLAKENGAGDVEWRV